MLDINPRDPFSILKGEQHIFKLMDKAIFEASLYGNLYNFIGGKIALKVTFQLIRIVKRPIVDQIFSMVGTK